MKWSLEALAKQYKDKNMAADNHGTVGLGGIGLKAFYSALGVSQPVTADLSVNMVKAYQNHVLANLHPSYSSLTLLDTKMFLEFLFKEGATRVDYSSLIKIDLQAISTNDFAAYEQYPRWKS